MQSYSAALNGNAQYLGALAAGRAGRESVSIAQAQLLPNITFNYNHFSNSVTKKLQGWTSYSEPERYGSNSGALTLRQPLYRPAAWASYQRSLAMVAGADATQNAALQQLGVDVAQSYFDVLLAWETQQQLLSDRQAISAQLAAARKALSAGQGMRTDVDEAQARLDLVEARLLSARDAISQARRTLESQANMPVDRVRALNTSRLVLAAPEPADQQSW
ncbi:MAG: TolC family protein, partial [Limnohabitans sp.]